MRIDDPDALISDGQADIYTYTPIRSDFAPGTIFARSSSTCAKRSEPHGEWATPAKTSGSVRVSEVVPIKGGFANYSVVEAASDLCSLVTYSNGTYSNPVWSQRTEQPPFNPYASWSSWRVCVEA